MRGNTKREKSRERNICALDLDIQQKSKIPKPLNEKNIHKNILEVINTKIPKVAKNHILNENLPWKKGDLLDSLDLSTTDLKKLYKNRPKLCESPGNLKENKPEWLKENFRESINEWAPKKIEPPPQIKPTKRIVSRIVHKPQILENFDEVNYNKTEKKEFSNNFFNQKIPQNSNLNTKKETIIEDFLKCGNYEKTETIKEKIFTIAEENIVSKEKLKNNSKFVNKIRGIKPADDFLETELKCVEDEEAKLQASLARLDLKSWRKGSIQQS